MRILLITKDNDTINTVRQYEKSSGNELTVTNDLGEAARHIRTQSFDTALMDCSMRVTELIGFSAELTEEFSDMVVLLLGPLDTEQREKLSRRMSAHYSIDKPIRRSAFLDIMNRIEKRIMIVRSAGLIGRSPAIEETVQTIMQIGPTPITVLITGESGTGKEVIARATHIVSSRREQPFLAVNCAALAEGVLESELFGHEKGSFTGATSRRIGMFERANQGTIFLDEIGEIPHSTQIRLLRVLEEREIMRVGGTDVIPVDVRVIAATNRNLLELVDKGIFRRDLYYRIKVLEIKIPPLKERIEDIPLLIDSMVKQYSEENKLPVRRFSDAAKSFLTRYRWPGNVRELRNFVESTLALTMSPVIDVNDLPFHLLEEDETMNRLPVPREIPHDQVERELIYHTLLDLKRDLTEIKELLREQRIVASPQETARMFEVIPMADGNEPTLDDLERQAVIEALDHTNGNRRKAAKMLGIGERTLYRKLKEYAINK